MRPDPYELRDYVTHRIDEAHRRARLNAALRGTQGAGRNRPTMWAARVRHALATAWTVTRGRRRPSPARPADRIAPVEPAGGTP